MPLLELDRALAILQGLHAEHTCRLRVSGIQGVARVRLDDWRAACGIDDAALFWSIRRDLEVAGRIVREHGYARPIDNHPENST
jgi:hypothetical protein